MKYLQLVMFASLIAGATYGQITPHQSKEITPYVGRDLSTEQKKSNVTPAMVPASAAKPGSPQSLQFFVRKWTTGVSDAFYVNNIGGVRTLVVQANARTKPLHINSNGTYYWEAYGEQRSGKWEATGDKNYPIVLKNAIQNKDWYVAQHNNGKNAIYIWDHDAISYTGVPM
ncbi:hypothetical protein CLV59_105454 [Chitinophaga dinghuensis]|uniref:Uncharacterized protein n=1 Tax=Chitinophaga dinghuensis TaxID=1539050 RepID=A0A327VZI8_9BACT|nr:hypothetical protein [Chitinophaga dinghuensis]RAJ80345.1 hypothetical protein CLV59_105454 [Chitinophaga dinghuensis]